MANTFSGYELITNAGLVNVLLPPSLKRHIHLVCCLSLCMFITSHVIQLPNISIEHYLEGPPGPPRDLTLVSIGKDSATLSWEVPKEDGGNPVRGYNVERKETNSLMWTRMNRVRSGEPRWLCS